MFDPRRREGPQELKQLAQNQREEGVYRPRFFSAKALGDDGLMASDVLDQLTLLHLSFTPSHPQPTPSFQNLCSKVQTSFGTATDSRRESYDSPSRRHSRKAAAVDYVVLSPRGAFFAYLKSLLSSDYSWPVPYGCASLAYLSRDYTQTNESLPPLLLVAHSCSLVAAHRIRDVSRDVRFLGQRNDARQFSQLIYRE